MDINNDQNKKLLTMEGKLGVITMDTNDLPVGLAISFTETLIRPFVT